ncbi:Tn3 family transposase [Streptomyces sp. JH002]|uniref:Tn3 family transposase n=1 Tax=Streptomyces sp. JH002 TaxID=2763259 RepID=UPI003D8026A2
MKLGKLDKAEEPKLMRPFRQLVNGMLPKVTELTGMADAFTHISGADSRGEGFTTGLCAVLLTEACNVGFTPVIKPDVAAPGRGRLVHVDQGYFRAENISVANGLFIEARAKMDVVRAWDGGLVAPADGVRFTLQTWYAGSNPRISGCGTRAPPG